MSEEKKVQKGNNIDHYISRKSFDIQESVILLDIYLDMIQNDMSLIDAAKTASIKLRMLAKRNGILFDNSFRSPQGLCNRLRTISGVYEGTSSESNPATEIFVEAVSLYKNNRDEYEKILRSVKESLILEQDEASNSQGKEMPPFFRWLQNNVSSSEWELLKGSYNKINMLLVKSKVLDRVLLDVTSTEDIDRAIERLKKSFVNKGLRNNALKLLSTYRDYLLTINQPFELEELTERIEKKKNAVEFETNSELFDKVEKLIYESDLEGITLERLSQMLQGISMSSLKRIRDDSNKIICFYEKMIHRDAFVDLDVAAEKFHEIIEKLLLKNEGYVSSAQLFDYARMEMQMFLNDNDVFDEQKVFCIVRFLFEKIDWNGYHYEFSAGRHISRGGKEALKSNMDVILKFARERGGVFQWNELLEYLGRVGIEPNNLRVQMEIGTQPIFFYYSESGLITVESMRIDEKWILQTKDALRRLFDDVGDHIVIREIASFWYSQLPELPCRIQWNPILLQYVIKFYGEQLGARTIHSEMPQRYDTVHALLVKSDSVIQSFGDAVVSYIIDNGIEERCFQAEQLRKLLANGKLIGNLELIGNVPRAIGRDPRFSWDITEENVNIIF